MIVPCSNATALSSQNRATCESLPSQLANFSLQFYGDITKSLVNDSVAWSLPCGLDTGLSSNPRGVDEGLACYFSRLFRDIILANQGPRGAPGLSGCDGNNAFTVSLTTFSVPPEGGSVGLMVANPAIFGLQMRVFIQGSGLYYVSAIADSVVTFVLERQLTANGQISAGALIIPAGPTGSAIVGNRGPKGINGFRGIRGDQGPVGPQGPDGLAFVQYYTGFGGTDFSSNGIIDFGTSAPRVLLENPGKYLFHITVGIISANLLVTSKALSMHVVNLTTGVDVTTPFFERFNWPTLIGNQTKFPMSLSFFITTTSNNVNLGLRIVSNAPGSIKVSANQTSFVVIGIA